MERGEIGVANRGRGPVINTAGALAVLREHVKNVLADFAR